MYKKIFSLGYPSFTKDPSLYYNLLKNSSQQYRDEIYDIYFSYAYRYEWEGEERIFGDVMGATISDAHLDYIFKIQDELGISISLTFNETYPHRELTSSLKVFGGFVEHLRKFYDRGLRSCTISHVHMMALGVLQKEFPEMKWKNTVNHIVVNPQQIVDLHLLGYDVINLDRSLNRDMNMLRQMQKVRKKYPNLILSLLVSEGCMPHCPFKVEHDTMNKNIGWSYWDEHGQVSCVKWRHQEYNNLPRIGTEMVWADKATFNEYAELVDYFKFSGRMGSLPSPNPEWGPQKLTWSNVAHIKGQSFGAEYWNLNELIEDPRPEIKYAFADSFSELMNNTYDDAVISNFRLHRYAGVNKPSELEDSEWIDSQTVWGTKKGKSLNHVLKTCKNECWDCHACEKTFGIEPFDSLIEVNRDVSKLRSGHIQHFNPDNPDS